MRLFVNLYRWHSKDESLVVLHSIATCLSQHRVSRDITELFLPPTCTDRDIEFTVDIHRMTDHI